MIFQDDHVYYSIGGGGGSERREGQDGGGGEGVTINSVAKKKNKSKKRLPGHRLASNLKRRLLMPSGRGSEQGGTSTFRYDTVNYSY